MVVKKETQFWYIGRTNLCVRFHKFYTIVNRTVRNVFCLCGGTCTCCGQQSDIPVRCWHHTGLVCISTRMWCHVVVVGSSLVYWRCAMTKTTLCHPSWCQCANTIYTLAPLASNSSVCLLMEFSTHGSQSISRGRPTHIFLWPIM